LIVIVGHGPSILSGLGSVIDSMTVVRLKKGLVPKAAPSNWGTRTDYLCARSLIYDHGLFPFWHFNDDRKWLDYYAGFKPRNKKPSTGLCAVFCAVEHGATELAVIGFDRLIKPEPEPVETHHKWSHDERAEHDAMYGLGIRIIDLVKDGNAT